MPTRIPRLAPLLATLLLALLSAGGVRAQYLSASPIAAYGSQRVIRGYNGPLYRVVRTTDDATLDVFPAPGHDRPDIAAILAFQGSDTLTVDILYDQSGRGNHATQPNPTFRPDWTITHNGLDPRSPNAGQPISFDSLSEKSARNGKWMAFPPTVRVPRNDHTALLCVHPYVSLTENAFYTFVNHDATTNAEMLCTASAQPGLSTYNSPEWKNSNVIPRVGVSVLGYTATNASATFFLRESTSAAPPPTPITLNSGGAIGEYVKATTNARFDLYCLAFYNRALPEATAQANLAKLRSAFGVYTGPYTHRVVFTEDSISAGQGGTYGLGYVLQSVPRLWGWPEIFNCGVGARTTAVTLANYLRNEGGLVARTMPSLLFFQGGTNDLITGLNANATYRGLADLIANAHTSGYRVTVTTILPAIYWKGARLSAWNAINPLIRANGAGADSLADWQADSVMGRMEAITDPLLYPDGVHPSSEGALFALVPRAVSALNEEFHNAGYATGLSLTPSPVFGSAMVTGKVTLNAASPTDIRVILSSSDTRIAQVPASIVVPAGSKSATFPITTFGVDKWTPCTLRATAGGESVQDRLTVAPLMLDAFKVDPSAVAGGSSVSGTVSLNGPAPAGGRTIFLRSSDTALAAVPDGVFIAAGSRTAAFSIATFPAAQESTVTLTASLQGVLRAASLTIQGIGPARLSLRNNPIRAGNTATGTVTLNGTAPAGGLEVQLASSNTTIATVPEMLFVPGGASTATFPITTFGVLQNTDCTISASANGVTATRLFSVYPAQPSLLRVNPKTVKGGGIVAATVVLNGKAPTGGLVVSLSSSDTGVAALPATVTVPAGANAMDFRFQTGPVHARATITLAASALGIRKIAPLTVIP